MVPLGPVSLVLFLGAAQRNSRPDPSGMTISLLVPCTPSHFLRTASGLNRTLSAYADATVHPDEVIISLSGPPLHGVGVPPARIEALRSTFARVFARVEIIVHAEPRTAGENRNAAGARATSDLLIYSDADDTPHPQRLSVLAHWFAKEPSILMIHHTYVASSRAFRTWTARALDAVRRVSPEELTSTFDVRCRQAYPAELARAMVGRARVGLLAPEKMRHMPVYQPLRTADPIHTGNLALRRSVLTRVSWPTFAEAGEDKAFSWAVVAQLGRSIVIEAALLCYCASAYTATCARMCAPLPVDPIRWPPVQRIRMGRSLSQSESGTGHPS